MPVVMLLAAAVIIGGVVAAAFGGAGEMAAFPADHPPLVGPALGPGDVSALRAPMALWGYHPGFVDETMSVIARSMAAQQAQIADLRREVAELRAVGPQSPVRAEPAGHAGASGDD